MRNYPFLAVLVTAMLSTIGCQAPKVDHSSKPHIRISVSPAAFFLPLIVAHDERLFEKHGVASELIVLNSTSVALTYFLRGDAELTAVGSGGAFLLENESPGRFRFVYGQHCRSYSLLVTRESPIKSFLDLNHKMIGTWPSPTPRVLLSFLAAQENPAPEFELIPIESQLLHQALVTGQVDAAFVTDVHVANSLATGATKYLSKNPLAKVVDPFFNGGGIVSSAWERSHPQAAVRIRAALEEAIDLIATDRSKATKSLVKHLGVEDAVAANAEIDDFVKLDNLKMLDVTKVLQLFKDARLVAKDLDVSSTFRTEKPK